MMVKTTLKEKRRRNTHSHTQSSRMIQMLYSNAKIILFLSYSITRMKQLVSKTSKKFSFHTYETIFLFIFNIFRLDLQHLWISLEHAYIDKSCFCTFHNRCNAQQVQQISIICSCHRNYAFKWIISFDFQNVKP